MNKSRNYAILAVTLTFFSVAQHSMATTLTLSTGIDSQTAPWDFNAGLNSAFTFGPHDFAGVNVYNSGNGWDFSAGNSFKITPFAGLTSPYGGVPYADAGGDTTYLANDNPGSSGQYFPSKYFAPSDYPAYLNELVGVFTDYSGVIVGTPFNVGLGGTFIVPAGAHQLQLGLNDDIFSDNTGELFVEIAGPALSRVPDSQNTLALFSLSCAGLIWLRRRSIARASMQVN